MSEIFAADYDDDDSAFSDDDDAFYDTGKDDITAGGGGSAAGASEAAALAGFDQDAHDAATLARFTPVATPVHPISGGTMRLLGTAPPSITGGITNHNAMAGASAINPTIAISATSQTPRTTPTLVSTAAKTGNHVFFVVLLLALVFFAWREA